MAGNYRVASQVPDIQVLSGNRTLDVERVGIETAPTGIYVEYPIDRASWLADHGAQLLGALATSVESLIDAGLAETAEFGNGLDAQGLLVDYLDFLVVYVTPPPLSRRFEANARVPVSALIADSDPWVHNITGNPTEILLQAFDALKATAAL